MGYFTWLLQKVIKSKVCSTKGGVTGGSKSYVSQIRLEDFTMLAATGGMGQTYLDGKKEKFLLNYIGWFCEKGAIIPGLL